MPSLDTKASGFRPRVGGTAPKPADRGPCLGFKDFAERFLQVQSGSGFMEPLFFPRKV